MMRKYNKAQTTKFDIKLFIKAQVRKIHKLKTKKRKSLHTIRKELKTKFLKEKKLYFKNLSRKSNKKRIQ